MASYKLTGLEEELYVIINEGTGRVSIKNGAPDDPNADMFLQLNPRLSSWMTALIEHKNDAISYDELIKNGRSIYNKYKVFSRSSDAGADEETDFISETDRPNLQKDIGEIHRKIRDKFKFENGKNIIENISGFGYKINCDEEPNSVNEERRTHEEMITTSEHNNTLESAESVSTDNVLINDGDSSDRPDTNHKGFIDLLYDLLFGSTIRKIITITVIAAFLVYDILLWIPLIKRKALVGEYNGKVQQTEIAITVFRFRFEAPDYIPLKLSSSNTKFEEGMSYWQRLDYANAEKKINEAIKSIDPGETENESDVATMNYYLGRLYLTMGRYEDANEPLNMAYTIFSKIYGKENKNTLSIQCSIAQYEYFSGDVETALKTLQRISDYSSDKDFKVVYVLSLHLLAQINNELGNYDTAIENYRSILSYYSDIMEDKSLTKELADCVDDPHINEKDEKTAVILQIIKTYNELGKAYLYSGQYSLARENCDIALQKCLENKYIGTKNLTTSEVYMNLAEIDKNEGKIKEALESIRLAEDIQNNLFGFENVYPGLVKVYDIYGDILMLKGDQAAAEKYYKDAVALAVSSFGEYHPATADAYNSLGTYQLTIGEFQSASASFNNAVDIRKRLLGYDSITTARYLYYLAITECEMGNDDVAMEYALSAKSICQKLDVTGELVEKIDCLLTD